MSQPLSRRAVVALVSVLSLAFTAVAVVLVVDQRQARTADQALDALQVCVAQSDDRTRSGCFDVEFARAVQSGSLPLVLELVSTLERENPSLQPSCRAAAISAGRKLGSSRDPVEALRLVLSDEMVCSNGFVMGTFEGLSEQAPDVTQYASLAEMCAQLPGTVENLVTTEVKTGCVDGLGHAAWLDNRDMADATRLCLLFPLQDDRGLCVSGIFHAMRLSEQPGSALLDPSRREGYCDAVRTVSGIDELVNVCHSGVALGMSMLAAETARTLMQMRSMTNPPVEPDSLLEPLRTQWGSVLETCSTWGEQAKSCHDSVLWELQKILELDVELCRDIVGRSPFAREDACTPLTP
jgi:hypothetical protein